jgi:hypothetical protein
VTDQSSETTNGAGPDQGPAAPEAVGPDQGPAAPEAVGAARGGGGPFDLNAQQKKVLIAVLVVHVIVARFTLRDLRRRPASAVRGPKRLWRVWATLNTTGSVAYWLVGRRRDDSAPTA